MRLLARHRNPVATTVARWAMNVGTNDRTLVLAVLVLLVVAVVVRRWRRGVLTVVGSVVLAEVVARVLKHLIGRPRPPREVSLVFVHSSAMPSTVAAMTAAGAVALYAVVPWPINRRWVGWLLVLAAVWVGIAMVYLGAHWPSDVLAGWCVGLIAGGLVVRLSRRSARPAPKPVQR